MKSGPELDRLVAEKVFGMVECDDWEPISFGSAGGCFLEKLCHHDKGKCWPKQTVPNMNGEIGGCPKYSTDVSWARKVLKYLEDNAQMIELTHEDGEWSGGIANGSEWLSDDDNKAWVEGSFEYVVCKLALMFVKNK